LLSCHEDNLVIPPWVRANPVFQFFHTQGSAGPFVLRLAVAAIFFYHSSQKAFGWFGGIGWNATIAEWSTSLSLPYAATALIICGELAICLSLFFGFFTRLGALGVLAITSGSLVVVSRTSAAIGDYELPALLWASGAALICLGAGAWSMDRTIGRVLLPSVG